MMNIFHELYEMTLFYRMPLNPKFRNTCSFKDDTRFTTTAARDKASGVRETRKGLEKQSGVMESICILMGCK